jgi:hypothetical protein
LVDRIFPNRRCVWFREDRELIDTGASLDVSEEGVYIQRARWVFGCPFKVAVSRIIRPRERAAKDKLLVLWFRSAALVSTKVRTH